MIDPTTEHINNNNNNNNDVVANTISSSVTADTVDDDDATSDNTTTIVLFYKYFIPSSNNSNNDDVNNNNNTNHNNDKDRYYYIQKYSNYYLPKVQQYIQQYLCSSSNSTRSNQKCYKGRILLATEGINGTISSTIQNGIQSFIQYMEELDIIQQFGLPPTLSSSIVISDDSTTNNNNNIELPKAEYLFRNIDWKISTTTNIDYSSTTTTTTTTNRILLLDPFPDLKISIVNEIISTGISNNNNNNSNNHHDTTSSDITTTTTTTSTSSNTGITVQDMITYGTGQHVSPTEFHTLLETESNNILLFDIRNTFEYDIGHFIIPTSTTVANTTNNSDSTVSNEAGKEDTTILQPIQERPAIHPKNMVQFSTLESILDDTIFTSSSSSSSSSSSPTTTTTECDDMQNKCDNPNATESSSNALSNINLNINNNENRTISIDQLQNKKILLYCTGGIRCEKASVMFRKYIQTHQNSSSSSTTNNNNNNGTTTNSNNNVYQLSGGIHRYIEQYGSKGYYKGKNFVFDQRIVQNPADYDITIDKNNNHPQNTNDTNIVGRCIECNTKFDELCGSRICTVCRDLVLVCTNCQITLREYHCTRHQQWKHCYYTFLHPYTISELQQQYINLQSLRDGYIIPQRTKKEQQKSIPSHDQQQQQQKKYKNVRRTLYKQMNKVQDRIHAIQNGIEQVDMNAIRRCRTCMEPNTICDGKCWGFWKVSYSNIDNNNSFNTEPILPMLSIGTMVEPGPNWNELRFGSKYIEITDDSSDICTGRCSSKKLRQGIVTDVKTWGSNSTEYDCVAVQWMTSSSTTLSPSSSLIYRWGVMARNGQRMYDLQRSSNQ